MKILIVNELGQSKIISTNIIPRVGDSVDLFYSPYPKVESVLLYPRESTVASLGLKSTLDAIVTVSSS